MIVNKTKYQIKHLLILLALQALTFGPFYILKKKIRKYTSMKVNQLMQYDMEIQQ